MMISKMNYAVAVAVVVVVLVMVNVNVVDAAGFSKRRANKKRRMMQGGAAAAMKKYQSSKQYQGGFPTEDFDENNEEHREVLRKDIEDKFRFLLDMKGIPGDFVDSTPRGLGESLVAASSRSSQQTEKNADPLAQLHQEYAEAAKDDSPEARKLQDELISLIETFNSINICETFTTVILLAGFVPFDQLTFLCPDGSLFKKGCDYEDAQSKTNFICGTVLGTFDAFGTVIVGLLGGIVGLPVRPITCSVACTLYYMQFCSNCYVEPPEPTGSPDIEGAGKGSYDVGKGSADVGKGYTGGTGASADAGKGNYDYY